MIMSRNRAMGSLSGNITVGKFVLKGVSHNNNPYKTTRHQNQQHTGYDHMNYKDNGEVGTRK